MRPFTLGRLADVIRLTRVFRRISPDQLEEAMMVTRDRAVELLKQTEEMKLIRADGSLYHSTTLGSAFFEAFKSNDRAKLDYVLSEYPPYAALKNALSKEAMSMSELKKTTGLTEVAVEIMSRLLKYVRDDFCSINDTSYLRSKELPESRDFLFALNKAYSSLKRQQKWGQLREFILIHKIAMCVCKELRIPIDDFSKLLENALDTYDSIELHSETTGFQFMPYAPKQLTQVHYRKSYLRLRECRF